MLHYFFRNDALVHHPSLFNLECWSVKRTFSKLYVCPSQVPLLCSRARVIVVDRHDRTNKTSFPALANRVKSSSPSLEKTRLEITLHRQKLPLASHITDQSPDIGTIQEPLLDNIGPF